MLELQVRGRPAPQGSKKTFPIYKGKGAERQLVKINTQEMSPHVGTWREDVKAAAERFIESVGRCPDPQCGDSTWDHDCRLGPDWTPMDGPIRVRMVFTIAKPASRPKRRRTWPDTMPDLSKLCRSTEDALTAAGLWKDDARVVEYTRLAKVYPGEDPDSLPVPGVRIWVEQVTEEDNAA